MTPDPPTTSDGTASLRAALDYARRGWKVLRWHAPLDGGKRCSCGKQKCAEDGKVAKHPWTPHSFKDATTDEEQIKAWWVERPYANVAIETGAATGLLVLDIDVKDDANGYDTLTAMEAQHGPLPRTVTAESGGGGRHYYFKHPGGHVKPKVAIAPGLDVRADGACIIAPPSMHRSMTQYAWAPGRSPVDVELAPCPDWIVELANQGTRKNPHAGKPAAKDVSETGTFGEGERNAGLTREAGKLRRQGFAREQIEVLLLDINRKRCAPPLDEDEVRQIAQSVERYRESDSPSPFAGRYERMQSGVVGMWSENKGSRTLTPLCDFDAWIPEEVILTDGLEMRRIYRIAGRSAYGDELPLTDVAAEKLEAFTWMENAWGINASIAATNGAKGHLKNALKFLSRDRKTKIVHAHSGWINPTSGMWYYLHGRGAIGPDGHIDAFEVKLPGPLRHLELPPPPEIKSSDLCNAVRESLALRKLSRENTVGAVMLGATYRAMVSEAAPSMLGIWWEGLTGSFKSQISALMQAHYGARFDYASLPGNWMSTANATEKLTFQGKDAIFVLDDYVPQKDRQAMRHLEQTAERVFRGAGNNSARDRMDAEGNIKEGYKPRGITVSSAETVPPGTSLKARLVITTVQAGDIDEDELRTVQAKGKKGVYATAMAGFARWLAPRMDELKATLPERVVHWRTKAQRPGARVHRRAPEQVANLYLGWELFIQYAREHAQLDESEANAILVEVWTALMETMGEQASYSAGEDMCHAFFNNLEAALSAGLCHFRGLDGQAPAEHAESWGWELDRQAGPRDVKETMRPKGKLVGYLPESPRGIALLLYNVAFAVAQEFGQKNGNPIMVTDDVLKRRLKERGYIKLLGGKRERNRCAMRQKVQGRVVQVMPIEAERLGGAPLSLTGEESEGGSAFLEGFDPDPAQSTLLSVSAPLVVEIVEMLCAKDRSGALHRDVLALADQRGMRIAEAETELRALVAHGRLVVTGIEDHRAYRTAGDVAAARAGGDLVAG